MIRTGTILLGVATVAAVLFLLLVPRWHWPVRGVQVSLQGPSMVQFAPTPQDLTATNLIPAALPPAPAVGPKAGALYQNVQVLKDASVPQFVRLMVTMTTWVAPKEGCGFCHEAGNFASDQKPQKRIARLMIRMTRHINAAWKSHVDANAQVGVTCYTCHRGQPVPSDVYYPSPPHPQQPFIEKQDDWNEDEVSTLGFFPRDSWGEYVLQDAPALTQSGTALPTGQVTARIVTKRVYEFMIQLSNALGVNCGFCHNSRAFGDWSQSTPYRWIAYYGIRMARDLNRNFIVPAAHILPQERIIPGAPRMPMVPQRNEGPQAGNALVICGTCHHGVPLPLLGVNMVHDYPELLGPDSDAGVPSPFPPLPTN